MHSEQLNLMISELAAKLNLIRGRELSMEGGLLLAECRTLAGKLMQSIKPVHAPQQVRSDNIQRTRVLVIDDDEDLQRVLQYVLPRREQIEVFSVTDPSQILAAIQSVKPEIIIVDVLLPGTSGFAVLSELKRHPETKGIKVIMGSARSYERDRLSAMQLGADDFFAKPYNVEELVLRIRYHAA